MTAAPPPLIPITILTGFLGSGKTSLLRAVLAQPRGRRIGVLLNERGVAGIDDVGVAKNGYVELAEGCVCCVDQPDLVAAVLSLSARGDLDRIVLETSGLADPLPISWSLATPPLSEHVLVDAVVTVVDAKNQSATQVAEWAAQVRNADVVVESKLDLASDEEVLASRAAVLAQNPRARFLTTDEAHVALLEPETFFAPASARMIAAERPIAAHGDFATRSYSGREVYAGSAVEDLVEDLPASVFRAKGIVRVGDEKWLAFQAVGGRVHVDLFAPAPSHGESRMLFFGRALDGDGAALDARVAACRATGLARLD